MRRSRMRADPEPRVARLRVALVVCASALLCAAPGADAQAPGYTLLGPTPVIGGVQVVCGGVPTWAGPIPDIALARPGLILLHDPMFFRMVPVVQVFIYAHECAHHVLGSNEQAADCWAVRTGRNQGWFRRQDILSVANYFGTSPGDWTHEPGPLRIQRMVACYDT